MYVSRWSNVRGVLRAETESFLDALDGSFDEVAARPTRLPAWTVGDLVAHVWRDLDRLREALAAQPAATIDVDAVSYWRAYDPATRGPEIAARAIETAARFSDREALAGDLRRVLDEGLAGARVVPDDRRVVTWGPGMRLDEFLATRVLEVAIHGLDLADALARDPWLTPGAASITRGILTRLLGVEPPAIQRMSDVSFFELASGRRRPGRAERLALGSIASRFPLLG